MLLLYPNGCTYWKAWYSCSSRYCLSVNQHRQSSLWAFPGFPICCLVRATGMEVRASCTTVCQLVSILRVLTGSGLSCFSYTHSWTFSYPAHSASFRLDLLIFTNTSRNQVHYKDHLIFISSLQALSTSIDISTYHSTTIPDTFTFASTCLQP
jgi:hypothetical protein